MKNFELEVNDKIPGFKYTDAMINLNKKFILSITFVSALGGLLFGYDWVVIGGAKPFYERFFDITSLPHLQGWAMSSALIGCLFGALFSGFLSDRLGRKIPLIIAAFLFVLSAIGSGASNTFSLFIIFRLVGGLGIGLASAISPMYIAEISPAEMRGKLVSINQLTIVIGILAAQVINFLIADEVDANASNAEILNSWNGQMGWRWMFWAETVPALLFFFLAFLIPESPRFLAKAGLREKSKNILEKIGGPIYAKQEEISILKTLKDNGAKINWKALSSMKVRPIIILGIVLAVFQQWCGINVIFNYAEEIFVSAGYSVSDMLFNVVITGAVNLILTVVAMQIVDRWGRRNMMLLGAGGLSLLYILLGFMYYIEMTGFLILVMVVLTIGLYALTLAPITWVILSEIFPNSIRGAAMAIATTSLWMACFVLTYTFPLLNKMLNISGTFWLYSVICISGFFFIFRKLPETKGKTLEEVEEILTGEDKKES